MDKHGKKLNDSLRKFQESQEDHSNWEYTTMSMIDKIIALRLKIPANGATEHEALAALELADKLMQKHGITEEELNNVQFKRDMRSGVHQQKQKAVHPSQKYCAVRVSRFCGTKTWLDKNDNNLKIFGFNGDVEMAEFLMNLIHDSMDRGWKEFLATNPKDPNVSRHTQYWSFMIGMANRINENIDILIEERKKYYAKGTGTDLVIVKNALITEGMSALLPSLKLKRSKRTGVRADQDAYGQGQTAGNAVNLRRPLKSRAGSKMIGNG